MLEAEDTPSRVFSILDSFMKNEFGSIHFLKNKELKETIEEIRIEIFSKFENLIFQESDLDALKGIYFHASKLLERFKERSDVKGLQEVVRDRIVELGGDVEEILA